MRFFASRTISLILSIAFMLGFTVLTLQQPAYSQETTGGLQGTVKDPAGAVVAKATVTLTGTTMIGGKELVTDTSGYYRFANLPPGTYTIIVKAQGFQTYKREGVNVDMGRLPTVDVGLQIGTAATTVEVTAAAPVIDTTTTENLTDINAQSLENLPTGISFQSVIQFAPMARNEPLSGMSVNGRGTGGTGGSMPGSSGNGNSFGYSIGGAADSESSYLVEGQDTENISGGYSKANVPMDFIDEVQMKTSGISAEYGGALGGVVNVVLKKGSNQIHGSLFSTYEASGMDANNTNAFLRYDPTGTGVFNPGIARSDPDYQTYAPSKDHFRMVQPGALVGGPLIKDRLWFVAGFNPYYASRAKSVNFGAYDNNAGIQYFTRDMQQYYGYLRFDAALSSKIRVFGSWLNQYSRETGADLPISDPISFESAYLNTAILNPLALYSHGLGWSAPNAVYNVGGDVTLSQHVVSTTRYGYFFENYHDFGWPTGIPNVNWSANGSGATGNDGLPLPTNLQNYNGQPANQGTQTVAYDSTFTQVNSDKHYQFNQDIAVYKGGWWGTHNFKFGYQLNHLINVISQNGNVPNVLMYPGSGTGGYSALTDTGNTNCGPLTTEWGQCAGQYGYVTIQDFSTILLDSKGNPTPASDWNHAFYVQDSWTVGKGLTLDLGLRIEKETLPAPAGVQVPAIDFSWSDKIEPRLGAAWDPTRKGKMKVFGSYGVVNDVMKLLLAQTSWGAQAYEDCTYPLGPDGTADGFSVADMSATFVANRACPNGPPTTQANFTNGIVPTALTDAETKVSIIENVNFRPWEPVAPNVKPYRQHEFVVGWDYQINPNFSFEARYDRRRLDHVIEDASLSDKVWGEMFAVVNPGEGVNATMDQYSAYLASLGQSFGVPGQAFSDTADFGPGAAFGTCPSCPAMPKAIRDYDGLEFRLTVSQFHHLAGMFSYTYSRLWGNYAGLTTTDQSDGGITGRNSPDTTRAFDEPFYYFGENGLSNNGRLATDRPNVLKGFVYYTMPWGNHESTTIGLFQNFLQGTPLGSYIDVGGATNGEPYDAVYPWGRDKWVDVTTDAAGDMTFGNPYTKRTPWYIQSDMNIGQELKVGEGKSVKIEFTAQNAFNERNVAAFFESIDSWNNPRSLRPGGYRISQGAAAYQAYESGYNTQSLANGRYIVMNSQYGQPYLYQNGRQFRIAVHYNF
jgi:hypothetical protein